MTNEKIVPTKFEAGKSYYPNASWAKPITIERRSNSYVTINGKRKLIRTCGLFQGDEYVLVRYSGIDIFLRSRNVVEKPLTKDGWHTISGYHVHIENGRIDRGMTADKQRTTYIYRHSKTNGYDKEDSITIDAFRSGVRRGTIIMA